MKILNLLFLILYCLFIYYLSDQESLPAPMWFKHQDKLYHGGAYFVMGILAWSSFSDWISSTRTLLLFCIAFCSLYGVSDEWHQTFVTGRDSSSLDWMADTFGAVMAILICQKISSLNFFKKEALK
jgi:VanZ family protein